MSRLLIIKNADFSANAIRCVEFDKLGKPILLFNSITNNLSMMSANPNANIHYTLDGNTPTGESDIFRNNIGINGSKIISAITIVNEEASKVPDLQITYIVETGRIQISSDIDGIIRYTTDGTVPDIDSDIYNDAINVTSGLFCKACVFDSSGNRITDVSSIKFTI